MPGFPRRMRPWLNSRLICRYGPFASYVLYFRRLCVTIWLISLVDNLGVVMNFAAAAYVGVALKYYDFLRSQLELSARGRAVGLDY